MDNLAERIREQLAMAQALDQAAREHRRTAGVELQFPDTWTPWTPILVRPNRARIMSVNQKYPPDPPCLPVALGATATAASGA